MNAEVPCGSGLTVLTPSYGPDAELCADLNRSVMEMTDDVEHHIVVPRSDRKYFSEMEGTRTFVHDVGEFLPRHLVKAPGANVWLNTRRPWPPVRGWIAQQLVKLSAAASFQSRGVLLMDSDMVLIRRTSLDSFMLSGRPAFYRNPGAVHAGLPLHRKWHETSRSLLGLAPPPAENLPDYISWPCLWEPGIVRSLLSAVEAHTGRTWATAIGSQLHFSEMILYGVYVDEVLGGAESTTSRMKSVVYSEERPLGLAELSALMSGVTSEELAIMISAKSGTGLHHRRQALADVRGTLADDKERG
ncbi:hypothetical protein J2X01_001300 [Arthrobacter ginsengisoli]|uniref:Uncharacterized protein n=1 Tax=Arthrobacter ginsengisoli TaxID=1356565 RepID=A0ABU1UA45_9MICC|nr:DUF6492 family protein [Arthrobacter ginsengisoli]MDR7082015.1 hypothetical protein [Arthrobacter ginsengisoli]